MRARNGSANRSSVHRPADDHYATPPDAVWPLVRDLSLRGQRIWEPACGDGAISRVLEAAGNDVVSHNLTDRGYGEIGRDFLATKRPPAGVKILITNPPFSAAEAFVLHALSMRLDLVCMLLRLKWLEGAARYERILQPHPPGLVLVSVERVKFFAGDTPRTAQPGWNTEAFAWFCWGSCWSTGPRLGWFRRWSGPDSDARPDQPPLLAAMGAE